MDVVLQSGKMKISGRIRRARKDCGLTQQELAAKCGVTKGAVSQWENDNGLPEISKIVKIGKICDISLDFLLTGKEFIN